MLVWSAGCPGLCGDEGGKELVQPSPWSSWWPMLAPASPGLLGGLAGSLHLGFLD